MCTQALKHTDTNTHTHTHTHILSCCACDLQEGLWMILSIPDFELGLYKPRNT